MSGARDPVLREVIQSALDTAVEEGGLAAARAAGSPFVSSAGAIACALFDRDGRQVAQTAGGLLHVAALRVMLGEVRRARPEVRDGDVFLLNDHFRGGIHPTDVGVFRPVVHDGALVGWVATMMIVSDLGGMSAGGLPANATEIWHEGMVIPVVPYHEAGRPNDAIIDVLRANSRVPDKLLGDVDALVTGAQVAAARTVELHVRYGTPVVDEVIVHLREYAARLARLGIGEIPDGTYHGSYAIEDDGIEPGRDLVVRCTITIDGERCHVDFTGTDRQSRGAVNSSYSQSLSGVVYALRCYLDPTIPMNEGFYDVITATLPEGTLVNPRHPAAANLRMGVVHAILDAVNEAFAGVFPDHVVAAGSVAATATFSGARPGSAWTMLDAHFGVGGARRDLDGVDGAPSPVYASPGWDRSIEGYEWEYPVRYECFRLLPDSAGPGRTRGSAGVEKRIVVGEDAWLTVRSSDRFARGPRGVEGGGDGRPGAWVVTRADGTEERLPPKKTNHFLHAGDRLTFVNAGGGGLGDPHLRPLDAVRRDVRSGVVSAQGAADDYGVRIDADGRASREEGR